MAHHSRVRSQWIGPPYAAWQALNAYTVFTIAQPAPANGWYYEIVAITTGISGAAPPVWPTVSGNTVVDGGVTWECMYRTSIQPTELATLDANIKGSLNGVDGGAYAPAAPIVLSGFGMQLTGPLSVARGGVLQSRKGMLTFDPGNFPLLGPTHTGRTRNVVYSFVDARPIPHSLWRVRRDSSAMQSIAPAYQDWQTGLTLPARMALRIRGMQYADISSVTVTFSVVTPHTSLPTTMPSFRLLQVDAFGNGTPMTSVAAGADVNGWCYVPKPSSPTAWENGQAPQSFTFPVDLVGEILRNEYTYVLEVREEQGLTGFPWVVPLMQPCRVLNYGPSFPLAGLAAIDGYTPTGGERVLVLDTPFDAGACETGIYIAAAGDWVRAPDLNQASQFGQGFIVGIQQGNSYGGTFWQASATVADWSPGTTPPVAAWSSVSGYTLNQPVLPLASTSGFWYLCEVAGTSGSDEPAWPTSPGQTVTDGSGSLVWRCLGPAAGPLPMVTRPDTDVWQPGAGTCLNSNGIVFHAAKVTYTNIYFNRWQ